MDETTDVAGKEQATIIIRHVKDGNIHEDFVTFVHATDLSGQGLATLLIDTVHRMGLKMSNCRGLGFNGASSMMGKFKGCAAIVAKDYPMAKVVHCFNHRLNLVLTVRVVSNQ